MLSPSIYGVLSRIFQYIKIYVVYGNMVKNIAQFAPIFTSKCNSKTIYFPKSVLQVLKVCVKTKLYLIEKLFFVAFEAVEKVLISRNQI